jgi:hypothetical protein
MFGGYNVVSFGDFFQIPPIPSTSSFTIPQIEQQTEHAQNALDMFWGDGEDSLNYFVKLTVQKRAQDPWHAALLEECRYGALSDESYIFLVGLPT